MKKSEIYRKAQILVLRSVDLVYETQLEMLRELILQEDMAKFAEEQEAKQQEAVEG